MKGTRTMEYINTLNFNDVNSFNMEYNKLINLFKENKDKFYINEEYCVFNEKSYIGECIADMYTDELLDKVLPHKCPNLYLELEKRHSFLFNHLDPESIGLDIHTNFYETAIYRVIVDYPDVDMFKAVLETIPPICHSDIKEWSKFLDQDILYTIDDEDNPNIDISKLLLSMLP